MRVALINGFAYVGSMDPITFLPAFATILAVLALLATGFGADSRGWEDPRPWWPGYGE
jgi:hypothetical protein